MHVCFTIFFCLPVRVFHWAFPTASASFSVTHAVWPPPYLPPFLPRATFPVLLSLPAPASLDFVSDFPRKRLCAGHGVKNTAFLMHSLGKQTKRPLPPALSLSWPLSLLHLSWRDTFRLLCCLLNMNFKFTFQQQQSFYCNLFGPLTTNQSMLPFNSATSLNIFTRI